MNKKEGLSLYNRNTDLEEVCFETKHVEEVYKEMQKNFNDYFKLYIETCSGLYPSEKSIQDVRQSLGIEVSVKDIKEKEYLLRIISNAIKEFEKDVDEYEKLFDLEALEEYEEDPASFKNDLKKECSMIRKTLNRNNKSLDEFKKKFKYSKSEELLQVCTNIVNYAIEYPEKWEDYDYDHNYTVEDLLGELLELEVFDEEGYGVRGVIGGGIKSYIAHKLVPAYFPHRSREGIWALWYLSGKKDFGCEEDSEFLMILEEEVVTHQNFYYPYGLFSIYSYLIYKLLLIAFEEYEVILPEKHRYVIVKDFLHFVTVRHEAEITELSRNLREE